MGIFAVIQQHLDGCEKIIKQVFWEVFEEKKNLRGWLVFFHCHATRLEQLDDESLAKKPDRPTHKCYKCLFPSST